MWRAHPIEGVGPANFERRYLDYSARIGIDDRAEPRSAHSLYLEALAETGLIGAIPLFGLILVALRRAWQARRNRIGDARLLAEGSFVALVAFLVSAVTLHNAFPRFLWVFARSRSRREAPPTGNTMIAAVVFWAAVAAIVWVYVGYPAVLALVGRFRPRPRARAPLEVPVSVVVAAHNEDAIIANKVENLLRATYPAPLLEVVVASDGSSDRTVERARDAGAHS